MKQMTYDQVLASIDREAAARAIASAVIYLGGQEDWGTAEFGAVQEDLTRAIEGSGLPHYGDQDRETLRFWGLLCRELDYQTDYEAMYVAIQNVPGYLGMDDDPPTFTTPREAWDYLAAERRAGEDDALEEGDGKGGYSATVNVLDALAAGDWDNWGTDEIGCGSVVGPTPGYDGDHDLGLAYTVRLVED